MYINTDPILYNIKETIGNIKVDVNTKTRGNLILYIIRETRPRGCIK